MITFKHSGDFNHKEMFLKKASRAEYLKVVEQYCQQGVQALAEATPVDSGKTASSWNYNIERSKGGISIYWTNSNINKGVNIAIILQYGHGTRNGGYVQGRDYINPALRPIFDAMADGMWKEVTSL